MYANLSMCTGLTCMVSQNSFVNKKVKLTLHGEKGEKEEQKINTEKGHCEINLVVFNTQFEFPGSHNSGVGWLVGCFRFNGPLRQYISLYRGVSQKEEERKEIR